MRHDKDAALLQICGLQRKPPELNGGAERSKKLGLELAALAAGVGVPRSYWISTSREKSGAQFGPGRLCTHVTSVHQGAGRRRNAWALSGATKRDMLTSHLRESGA